MTEIPEHLLKRSRERRSATGGAPDEGGDAGSSAPAASASAPAVTTSAAPAVPAPTAPPAPAPPKPDPAHIAAAKARPRIPYWAMGTLALLPVFLFMYVRGLTPQEAEPAGPIAIGVETYGSCSSCHGADGQGGAGRPFVNGEVLLTFPHIEDQLNFVRAGAIWTPTRNWLVRLGVQWSNRDSNRSGFDFSGDTVVFGTIQFGF